MPFLLSLLTVLAASGAERQSVLVVVGAPGRDEYRERFLAWAGRWEQAAARGHAEFARIGLDDAPQAEDKERLRAALQQMPKKSAEPLWLVLLGHGTYDGQSAKFNLRGPDLTAEELAGWLKPFDRPLAILNCTSASAPFLRPLAGPGRAVVTATKSGFEYNFARFGEYLSAAIQDEKADLDKDAQTSLLEAFLAAAAGVQEFYAQDARLATEHALIDDNGDGLGTPADWFRGVRAVRSAKYGALPDGLLASQLCLVRSQQEQAMTAGIRARRDALEQAIARLRRDKPRYAEEDYYRRLEALLLELARLYEQAESPRGPSPGER